MKNNNSNFSWKNCNVNKIYATILTEVNFFVLEKRRNNFFIKRYNLFCKKKNQRKVVWKWPIASENSLLRLFSLKRDALNFTARRGRVESTGGCLFNNRGGENRIDKTRLRCRWRFTRSTVEWAARFFFFLLRFSTARFQPIGKIGIAT